MPRTGTIVGVNGNHLTVEFAGAVAQNEVAYALLDTLRLKAEVVRVRGRHADLQLFESSAGLRVGDLVEFTGEPLSAELGPGLLGQIYDGLQNPLHALAERDGFFLQRGAVLPALDETRRWPFAPIVKPGMVVAAGDMLGTVPEAFSSIASWFLSICAGAGELPKWPRRATSASMRPLPSCGTKRVTSCR